MFSKRTFLAGSLTLAFIAAGCGATGASPSPTDAPSAVPTASPLIPTTAPATDPPAPSPTTSSADGVLSFDEISVEGFTQAMIDGGWFGTRRDNPLDSGGQQILLKATKSDVVLSILHDGAGTLQKVTIYDPKLFVTDASQFDMGIVGGVLLGQVLGLEFIQWEAEASGAKTANESLLESMTFGPDEVTLRYGADGNNPGDAFIYFEPAS